MVGDIITDMAYVTTEEISGFLTVFIGGCFAALGWFINRLVSNIDDKLKNICSNQLKYQLELPEKYVQKKDCEHDMAAHDASLIRLAGKMNGGRELHT